MSAGDIRATMASTAQHLGVLSTVKSSDKLYADITKTPPVLYIHNHSRFQCVVRTFWDWYNASSNRQSTVRIIRQLVVKVSTVTTWMQDKFNQTYIKKNFQCHRVMSPLDRSTLGDYKGFLHLVMKTIPGLRTLQSTYSADKAVCSALEEATIQLTQLHQDATRFLECSYGE